MPTQNNFIDSPPFGLYDIFSHLIYHFSDYDKQGLASYKAYDDYRLFDDGYVESLSTVTLTESGVHVYVGKVSPTMRTKTDDGRVLSTLSTQYYDLWFILEGKGPSRGSVLEAFCKRKWGRDGRCKHIGAAMYSLESLVNTEGKYSVTSGECWWQRRPRSSIKPCEVKEYIHAVLCMYSSTSTTYQPSIVYLFFIIIYT